MSFFISVHRGTYLFFGSIKINESKAFYKVIQCNCGRTFLTLNSLKSHARFCADYIKREKPSKEYKNIANKNYRERHRIKLLKKAKKFREDNELKIQRYNKNWNTKNSVIVSDKKKKYYKENKEQIKKRIIKRHYELLKTDILYKLKQNVRTLINNSFRDIGLKKNSKTEALLGCTFEEFKNYLESKFEPWMTWKNRGLYNGELNYGWDVDHIIPLSTAKTEEDIKKLSHYTNLSPLCSRINRYIKPHKNNTS